MPHLEMNLAHRPGHARHGYSTHPHHHRAADKDRNEMTVLLIHGEPAAVIAPYGYERRPGAAAEICFDQTAPPEARFMLTDVWGGSIRMRAGNSGNSPEKGVSSRMAIGASVAGG